MTAIQASRITGVTSTKWKLSDNTVESVTIDKLKQALILAIGEAGRLVGATV